MMMLTRTRLIWLIPLVAALLLWLVSMLLTPPTITIMMGNERNLNAYGQGDNLYNFFGWGNPGTEKGKLVRRMDPVASLMIPNALHLGSPLELEVEMCGCGSEQPVMLIINGTPHTVALSQEWGSYRFPLAQMPADSGAGYGHSIYVEWQSDAPLRPLVHRVSLYAAQPGGAVAGSLLLGVVLIGVLFLSRYEHTWSRLVWVGCIIASAIVGRWLYALQLLPWVALVGMGGMAALLLTRWCEHIWRRVALWVLVLWMLALPQLLGTWILDDAFISFRYAQNLVEGHHLTFNPGGELVEGYTNFLWTMIMALVLALGLDPVLTAQVLCTSLALITLVVVYRFAVAWWEERVWSLVPPLLLAVNPSFLLYTVRGSGMEPALVTLLALVALWLLWRVVLPPVSLSPAPPAPSPFMGEGVETLYTTAFRSPTPFSRVAGEGAGDGGCSKGQGDGEQPRRDVACNVSTTESLGAPPCAPTPTTTTQGQEMGMGMGAMFKRGMLAGGACALVMMARPDGVLVAMAGGVVVLWSGLASVAKHKQRIGVALSPLAGVVSGAALLYLPYFLWRWSYYGYLLPNTFYAKTGATTAQVQRGFAYTREFFLSLGLRSLVVLLGLSLLALLLPVLRRYTTQSFVGLSDKFSPQRHEDTKSGQEIPDRDAERQRRREAKNRAAAVLWVFVALTAIYVSLVGGDHFPLGRFFVPIVPPLALLLTHGLITALDMRHMLPTLPMLSRVPRWLGWVPVAVAVGALVLLVWMNGSRLPLLDSRDIRGRIWGENYVALKNREVGLWLRQETPSDTVIATGIAGALPFYAHRTVIDALGLNDLHIAHLQVETIGEGVAGAEKTDPDYILSRQPDIIPHSNAGIFAGNALFHEQYTLVTVRGPEGGEILLYVRVGG